MKKQLMNIWNRSKYGVILLGMIVIIGFTNSRLSDRPINEVSISVDNQFENYFIDQSDVLALMNAEDKDYLLNSDLGTLNLKELETRIETHQFVRDAQAFIDLNGNLSIEVKQNRPLARVINPEGADSYIGTKGDILPESSHYTARVILIQLEDMNWLPEYNIGDAKDGDRILEMIKFIANEPFWNAQISGIYIHKNMELSLHPQVTKQIVAFGNAENIENKFKRLKAFYKKILPYKGWNYYDSVNLKFKDQIVCKK
ncbi:MAG: cell division protein FtsQ [Reichenbachiella sp.]